MATEKLELQILANGKPAEKAIKGVEKKTEDLGKTSKKVGKEAEAYQQRALDADIARYEFEQNKPYTKLQSYLSAAYGAPMGQVSTTKSSGGGK